MTLVLFASVTVNQLQITQIVVQVELLEVLCSYDAVSNLLRKISGS